LSEAPAPGDECVATVEVANPNGVHARPSHRIVSLAQDFDAEVELEYDGRRAEARSILAVMTLGVPPGAELRIRARGPQAAEAVAALVAFLADPDGP